MFFNKYNLSVLTSMLSQDALSKKTSGRYDELCARYPVNNVSDYPDKRVYRDGDRFWELTELWLKVWATNMVKLFHIASKSTCL